MTKLTKKGFMTSNELKNLTDLQEWKSKLSILGSEGATLHLK
ncbi:1247_t:CDS:2 [Entrophospora sp. SA101]|nr:1247_t:CDS:2 [Entrophospora sp. SA101]